MASACEEVFRTVELVDLILSHLALRDLLAAQRVNYLWNQVVNTSSHMQRTKCLRADNSAHLAKAALAYTNPLYMQRFVQQACFYALQQIYPSVQYIGMDRFVVRKAKSFAEPEANWRNMLLFQPPAKLALLKSMSAHHDDGYYNIANPDGLTMGDVVEFFKRKVLDGTKAVDMLSATVTRKVVWGVIPAALPEHVFDEAYKLL